MEVRIVRSWKNRATTSVSETSSGLSTFTATTAPESRTLPRNTCPMAPRPSSSCSTYRLPKGASMRTPPLLTRWFSEDVREARYLHRGDAAALHDGSPERSAGRQDRQRQPDAERPAVEGAGGLEQQPALELRELGRDAAQRAYAVRDRGRKDPVPAIPQHPALGDRLVAQRGAGEQLGVVDDQNGLALLGQDRPQGTGRLGPGARRRQAHRRRGDGAGQGGGPGRDQDERVSGLCQRAGLD